MVRRTPLAVLAAGLLVLVGCTAGSGDEPTVSPPASPSIRTLSPLPPPPTRPATGRLIADLRQASLDAARGQMQVWVLNDTLRDVRPTRIVYRDGRFATALPATRLRLIPSRTERGFPIALPSRPLCDSPATSGIVTIWFRGRHETIKVHDETDVPGRYLATRCQELAVARVVELSWSDTVEVSGPGPGSTATLTLQVRPRGVGEGVVEIRTIAGTPMISTEGGAVWRPDLTVRATDPPTELPLTMMPARCDDHVFMEGGGMTAFKIHLLLDGKPLDLVVRMSDAGAAATYAFVRDSCDK